MRLLQPTAGIAVLSILALLPVPWLVGAAQAEYNYDIYADDDDIIYQLPILSGPVFKALGGRPAHVNAYPWIGVLLDSGNPSFRCGATLIHPQWALSAAHCVRSTGNNSIIVKFGRHNLTKESEPNEQTFQIVDIVMHPDFDADSFMDYDFALLKLHTSALTPTKEVDLLRLPQQCNDVSTSVRSIRQSCSELQAAGWGLNDTFAPSDVLKYVKLKRKRFRVCQRFFSNSNLTESPAKMCAQGFEPGVDTCRGDSGGPLMCKERRKTNSYHLVGVTSHGRSCFHRWPKARSAVYGQVCAVVDWIRNVTSRPYPTLAPQLFCSATLPQVRNGSFSLGRTSHGSERYLTCDEHHVLIGPNLIVCLDGIWTPNPPGLCQPVAGPPRKCRVPYIQHGRVKHNNRFARPGEELQVDEQIEYECHPGYTLFGYRASMCSQLYNWFPHPQDCQRI